MPEWFSDNVVNKALARANGRCECTSKTHGHIGRCRTTIIPGRRGYDGPGGWEAHHIRPDGGAGLDNCEIICMQCLKMAKDQEG